MIERAIYDIVAGKHLSLDDTKEVMLQIMDGKATDAQMGAFLAAMRLKGETIEEITACAEVMREKSMKLHPKTDVLDIVGTGGDELFTFNISTVSSFVVAAAGVPVAKHGNRSVSSKCGSADVLEALGANITLNAEQSERVLNKVGMCFMLSQVYHSAMKHVAHVRKELGVRTIFNILGPLANPAGANMQLLGVYDENLVEPLARVLSNLGVKRAMVVHGHDGLDEITLTKTSTICEVSDGMLNSYFVTPEQFGLTRCKIEDLVGGGPPENAEIARNILSGEKGPKRDIVVMNAACCIYMGKNNITMRECVRLAQELLDNGSAMRKLEEFVRATNEAGK
ncbi:anthranilate phosphoribosyltransferase [Candidatus Methanoplasma termitum]|uniref:Anthranilate phosphoribosyltransferase n=1 Tax=Candidatus Methanoplasma termitum TaxID=1577791 RepID=A0A0A7LEK2_9ARCH|nr:anthranilate phosphoribosyltransferase [Candidatus Methanoplasma termitum]AIZ55956.1 anthranilate phosphoribosyltransferase [Candidatus Methanoplasma termitum]MCL2334274.1 anthranilate phosphoribosyltransferase [Candidatus Methanoplasma sp.]